LSAAQGFLAFVDNDVSAEFTVCEIPPCSLPSLNDRFLINTKFIPDDAEIRVLRIDGCYELIGTTTSHLFWNEDRQQFVAAGELQVSKSVSRRRRKALC
jgi:CRISPR/Cas system-associated protein Csx1